MARELGAQIHRLRKRVRTAIAVKWAFVGLSAGLFAAAAGIAFGGRWWALLWEVSPATVTIVGAAGGMLAAILASLLVRLDEFAVCRTLERHSDLKDRLSSAVWAANTAHPQRTILARDALESLQSVDIARAIPLVHQRYWRLPVAATLVLIVAIALPSLSVLHSPLKKQEQAAIRQQGSQLRKVAARINKEPQADRQLAERLDKLGRQLQSGRLSPTDAHVKLNKMSDSLLKKSEKLAQANAAIGASMVPQRYAEAKEYLAQEAASRLRAERAAATSAGDGRHVKDEATLSSGSGMPAKDSFPRASHGSGNGQDIEIPSEMVERLAQLYGMKDFQEANKLLAEMRRRLGLKPSPATQEDVSQYLNALAKALENANMQQIAQHYKKVVEALNSMDWRAAQKALDAAQRAGDKLGSLMEIQALEMEAAAICSGQLPGRNEYGSTDREARGRKGTGNARDGGRIPGASHLDKDWAKLYAPRATQTQKVPARASSLINKNGQMKRVEVESAPEPGARASVPYYEVYPQYRDAAEKALSREDVPLSERKRVQEYFDALR